jgi:hypothetical protein
MDYGPLTTLVKSVGWLIGSSVAIAFAWRRRTRWEPSEEDISGGPAKVGGLLAAVALAVIWSQLISPATVGILTTLALWAAGLTLGCLLAYGFLVAVKTYRIDTSGGTLHSNIVGGLWLTKQARTKLNKKPFPTVSDLLAEVGLERTWSRPSRAFSKALFVGMYLGLTVSGSVALTCAGGLVLLSTNKQYQEKPECYNHDFHYMRSDTFMVCAENWSQLGTWPNTLSVSMTPEGSKDPDGRKTSERFWFSGSFAPYSPKKPFKFLITKQAYLSELELQKKSGFRPERVSILKSDSGLLFTAIWVAAAGQDYRQILDLSKEQFDMQDQQFRSQGLVLTDLSVYHDSGVRLAAIWVKRNNEGYEVAYNLPKAQFENSLSDLPKRHYQLTHILAYAEGDDYLYGGIWERNVEPAYYEYDLTGQQYQDYYRQQVERRRHPYEIVPYGDYYVASIWHN